MSLINPRSPALMPILALLAAMAIVGCGLYSDLKEATRDLSLGSEPGVGKYRMRILLASVQNRSAFEQEDYPAMFDRTLAASLAGECSRVQLIRPGDAGFPADLARIPETRAGVADNQAIADIGRRNRANAVGFATIYDISGKSERRGILWFREPESFVQFNVGVAAFDMETGAKILDETVSDEIQVDEFDLDMLKKEGRIENPDLEEALKEAAEDLAETACDAIEALPWKGFLLSGGNPVQIGAGEDVGIEKGDLFDVYAPGKEMAGLEGQVFFLPGRNIARVQVVSVAPDRATAEVVSSTAPLAPGYIVRPAQ